MQILLALSDTGTVTSDDLLSLWLWGGGIILLIVIIGFFIMRMQAKIKAEDPDPGPIDTVVDLESLRELLKAGKLSQDEFDLLKGQFIKRNHLLGEEPETELSDTDKTDHTASDEIARNLAKAELEEQAPAGSVKKVQ